MFPLHQQREPLTEFISCPVCCKVFNDNQQRPMSLSCGHTVCKSCLHGRLGNERCPFDQVPFPEDAEKLPSNYALMQLVEATSVKEIRDDALPGSAEYDPKCYEIARQCIQEISVYLKPLAENSSDDEGSQPTPSSLGVTSEKTQTKCLLSRPLQRKVISLIQCQIAEEEGRARAARIARSIGERILSEILSAQQYPHQLSANLWAAVRARGCQFLGPAMQEEALKLILLTLENGSMLSRKVLVLYVVGKLSSTYPHASKTAIGHVVQLLYRASCFKVAKRDEESSLMLLKEEFREYETLRREHDAQIVEIAMEAGLRIPPEQWSSLLYGDLAHKSHMQSIMDKLQSPQTFSQCVLELVQVLQRNSDPGGFLKLRHRFEFLSCIDPSPEAQVPGVQDMKAILQSLSLVMKAFINFLALPTSNRNTTGNNGINTNNDSQMAVPNARYKTSMCRDVAAKGVCPRGNTCTFAHSQEELDRHRLRSRRTMNKLGLKQPENGGIQQQSHSNNNSNNNSEMEPQMANLNLNKSNSPSSTFDDVREAGGQETAIISQINGIDKDLNSQTKDCKLKPNTDAMDSVNYNVNAPMPPPTPQQQQPGLNGTLLTFSQPAKEAPGISFLPQNGLQTCFHPHNMRGPPPSSHTPHPPHHHQHPSSSFIPHNAATTGGYQLPPRTISSSVNYPHYPNGSHNPTQNISNPASYHHQQQQHQQQQQQQFQQEQLIGSNGGVGGLLQQHPSQKAQSVSPTSNSTSNVGYYHRQNQQQQQQQYGKDYNGTIEINDNNSSQLKSQSQNYIQTNSAQNSNNLNNSKSDDYGIKSAVMTGGDETCTDSMANTYTQQQQQQRQPDLRRMATHSYGGPDVALHSLTNASIVHPQVMAAPTQQTAVIPAVLVDASTQEPIFHPHHPPAMDIAGCCPPSIPPHLPPPPQHQHQHLPYQNLNPPPVAIELMEAAAVGTSYPPLVQYIPTPPLPYIQVPAAAMVGAATPLADHHHPANFVVWTSPVECGNNYGDDEYDVVDCPVANADIATITTTLNSSDDDDNLVTLVAAENDDLNEKKEEEEEGGRDSTLI